jgi:hypothetical protein
LSNYLLVIVSGFILCRGALQLIMSRADAATIDPSQFIEPLPKYGVFGMRFPGRSIRARTVYLGRAIKLATKKQRPAAARFAFGHCS